MTNSPRWLNRADVMPAPTRVRVVRRATIEFADIVSGLLNLDPDRDEQWRILFANLDQRLPSSAAAHDLIAHLVRAIDALGGDQENEARRLLEAARANRARARRLRQYVLARATPAGLNQTPNVHSALKAAVDRPVLRIVGGTAASTECSTKQATARSSLHRIDLTDRESLDCLDFSAGDQEPCR